MWMLVGGGAHDAAAAGKKKNSAAGKSTLKEPHVHRSTEQKQILF